MGTTLIPKLNITMTTASNSNVHYAIYSNYDIRDILAGISQVINVNNYVTSILLLPFDVSQYANGRVQNESVEGSDNKVGYIIIGGNKINHVQNTQLLKTYFGSGALYRISENPDVPRFAPAQSCVVVPMGTIDILSKFSDFNDYRRKFELFLPYKGWVELDPIKYINKTVKITYVISLDDGTALIQLETSAPKLDEYTIVDSFSCQIGVNLPFATSDKAVKDVSNAIGTLGLITSTAGSLAVSIATKNPIGALGAIGGAVSGATQIALNTPTPVFNSGSAGLQNFYQPQNAILRISDPTPVYPENYAKLYGYPCEQYLFLRTLTGFTKIRNVHLENFNTATQSELTEIESLLKSGVIL